LRFSTTSALALAIVCIAAVLRLQNLEAIEHNVDHAYPIWQALNTLENGALPVLGQGTSVLFANPALTGYLYIPALLIVRSPYAPYLLVIALNTLAVALAYRAMRRVDESAALIGAFLLAVNPWVIEYSRTTWVQALLPFFACLTFALFLPVWLGRASHAERRFLLGCLALAAMTQTYLLAFAALVPVALLSVCFRRRISGRALWLGALIVVIPTAIYGAGLLSEATRTLERLRSFTGQTATLSTEALSHALRLLTGREYAAARGLAAPIQDSVLRFQLSELAHGVLLIALLIGAVHLWRKQRTAALIALVWSGMPILMMSYVSQAVHPFYLLLTLPALHLAAGVGLAQIARLIGKRTVGQIALTLVLAAFGALSALNVLRYAEESLVTPSVDGLSALPLGEGVRMARQLLSAEQIGASVVFADIDGWILNSFAGRLFEVDRDADATQTLYLPERGGVYLQFRAAEQAQAFPLPIAPFARYTFADGGTVAAWRVPREMVEPTRNVPSDKGLTLIDVQLDGALRAGQTTRLFISFRVDALPEARVHWLFAPFAHVYDASGARVLIADGAVTPGWAWRLGDIQRKTLHLHLPASAQAPFRVEIGLYDGVHGEAARFQVGEAWLPSLPVEFP
jgi:4-amino-4-deoxy-L-arabinose transferase-like glycosyltransferase